MVLLRSACLVLALLLTSLAPRDSGVHAQQVTNMAIVTNKKEGVPAAAATTNKMLGGKKLVQGSILTNNMMEEEAVNGKDKNALKKPLGTSQKNSASHLKYQDSEAVSNCGRLEGSSRSRKLVSPEFHDHLQKTESKKLLEAANHIVSLIHNDYVGMNQPRRKPPTNNHQPSLQSVKP